ncbi:hypothetical protein [Fusobacterium ulcerans]|uniref:hypothetical protein n=1 Tax=Fusobacterium ulcerans TaxID=861 RepID=UPI001031EE73|nr:hypothetical protein [Fusobacterium ulcerans]
MSYTLFSKEVTRWLKDNGLPWRGTAYDSDEVTQARLDAWQIGTKQIFEQWIIEKHYKELISCAHSGWYKDSVFFEPLAEHFVDNNLFEQLRFLCERGIRFEVENMLSVMRFEQEEQHYIDILRIKAFDLESYASSRDYAPLGEIAKYRRRALDKIIRYMTYLEGVNAPSEYNKLVQELQESIIDLNVKKSNLKKFKYKLVDGNTKGENK